MKYYMEWSFDIHSQILTLATLYYTHTYMHACMHVCVNNLLSGTLANVHLIVVRVARLFIVDLL